MTMSEERATRLREGLLGLGFLLLLAAAVFTVAVPELTKEPETEAPSAPNAKDPKDADSATTVGAAPTN
jgi:hypothetical protein